MKKSANADRWWSQAALQLEVYFTGGSALQNASITRNLIKYPSNQDLGMLYMTSRFGIGMLMYASKVSAESAPARIRTEFGEREGCQKPR